MLKLTIKLKEFFNDETNLFVSESVELELEHSLLSLSKWESEFEKPFLAKAEKSTEELLGYIRCMILTPDYPPDTMEALARDPDALEKIREYWNAPMTASSVPDPKNPPRQTETITSELIYYWMTKYEIDWKAESWPLSRLFMLIRIFGAKDAPAKKRTPAEMNAERKAENARRKAATGSRG